ncbi:succinylglutamate desuccinylase/aspartoacylase family protein [Sulfurospirillum sp. 1307]|jgi:predicted deacylase
MNKITISGVDIFRGERKDINLELPKLYNTPTFLPITVYKGKKAGPVIFISAAIHGDELNGIEIIRRFKKLKILKSLRGTVILLPIVNVYGTMTLSRYLPDRRDLNRSFPGSKRGSLAGRVANILFTEVISKCDFGIDLHTGAIHRSNFPQIRVDMENKKALILAKAFKAPVLLNSELREGSLRSCAQANDIPIIVYEAGEALRFDEASIRIGVNGIVNVLREKGMLPKKTNKSSLKTPLIATASQWTRSIESGILRTVKALGDTVEKDEIIAYIDDPLGDNSYTMKSPIDGIIIGKSEIPLVQEGDAVFNIAKFSNLEIAETKIEYFQENTMNDSEFVELNNEKIIE